MTQFLTTQLDKSLSAYTAWTDIDLSGDVPTTATGAIFEIVNTDVSNARLWGIRKKGSTDNIYSYIKENAHEFVIIGIDTNRKCQGKIQDANVDFYLVGYTESDATFFTNAYDKSQNIFNTWTDLDLSSELPSGAVAAIFQVSNSFPTGGYLDLRKKGSTDERYKEIRSSSHQFFIVGVDSNQKCQFKIQHSHIDFYLVGYLSGGSAETNGINRSLGSTGSYIDITETNVPDKCYGVWVDLNATSASSNDYAARKKGVTADRYVEPQSSKTQLFVGLDNNKKWEGKIESTYTDFYTLGYFEVDPTEVSKASSIGVSVQETHTKTSSIGASIQETPTKASSIGASIQETPTKASSIGLRVVSRVTKASSIGASIQETPTKASSIGASISCAKIKESSIGIAISQKSERISTIGTSIFGSNTKESSIGISIQEEKIKASSICLLVVNKKTKASSIGASIQETPTKASSIGASIQETPTKASSIGASIQETPTKASSIGASIQETPTKASSIGASIQETPTKASSIGASIQETPTKTSSIGLRVVSRVTKASSIGASIQETPTKTSSIGLHVVSRVTKASSIGVSVQETHTKTSSIGVSVINPVLEKSFFYAKLGNIPLEGVDPEHFKIVDELNRLPSFELELANSKKNKETIKTNINSILDIRQINHAVDSSLFSGIINADSIEYISLDRIRITGYAEYAKLAWPIFKHLNADDTEMCNNVLNFSDCFTNYTTEANTHTINDVLPSFSDVDHAFYIGENNIFWGLQIKYSTQGVKNSTRIQGASFDLVIADGTSSKVVGISNIHPIGNMLLTDIYLNVPQLSTPNKKIKLELLTIDTNVIFSTGDLDASSAKNYSFHIQNPGLMGPMILKVTADANVIGDKTITAEIRGLRDQETHVIIEFSKSNGIWSELDVFDETHAFTEAPGTYNLIIPHPPSNWGRSEVNGINKYWLRYRIVSGAYSIAPKLDRIKIVNADIYRVYYFNTSARTILQHVLKDTEYTIDPIDVCPEDTISILADYESPLRIIAAIPNALTWTDVDGAKKEYQWWIDGNKKVHIKKRRGTTYHVDLTSDISLLNNLEDYFHISNRLHGLGPRDGLSQMRAIVEDTTSQAVYSLREIVVPLTQIGGYNTLKERLQKNIAISKAPMQRIRGSILTEVWNIRGYEVGDTILLHQDEWNVSSAEFQIVKAEIGPLMTTLNFGVSQEYLDGLKANMQRQLDIQNIQMHGSTTLLEMGPETMNYDRISGTEVYSAKLNVEIPNTVKKVHKVLLSWTVGKYRASVGETTVDGGGQAGGNVTEGGALLSGFTSAGGALLSGNVTEGGALLSGFTSAGGALLSGNVGAGGAQGSGWVGAGGAQGSGWVGAGGAQGSGWVGAGGAQGSGNVGLGGAQGSGNVGAGGAQGSGWVGAGGAQGSGWVGAGGGFVPEVALDGDYIPTMLAKAHTHLLETDVTLQVVTTGFYAPIGTNITGLNHRHSGGLTASPSVIADALIPPLYMGSDCTSGKCVTGVYSGSFATSLHCHQNPNTGYAEPNGQINAAYKLLIQSIDANAISKMSNLESPAHAHTIQPLPTHTHTGIAEPAHSNHSTPAEAAHNDHATPAEAAHNDHSYPAEAAHSDHSTPAEPAHSDHSYPAEPAHSNHSTPAEAAHNDHSYPAKPAHSDHSYPAEPAHDDHEYPAEPAHSDHSYPAKPAHNDHSYPAEPAHDDHLYPAVPDFALDIIFRIVEFPGGTTLELLVNNEKVGEYDGPQTNVRIDGYLASGSNTIEIQPIVTEIDKKGSATISGNGILFIEPTRF